MEYRIKIDREVMNQIITHANEYPTFERGGYLIGKKKNTEVGKLFIVSAIYCDEFIGSENRYLFANNTRNSIDDYCKKYLKGLKVIGNYHSHGKYPAIFSSEDIQMTASSPADYCQIIYSPAYNELVGKIHLQNDIIVDAKITFIGRDKELIETCKKR